MPAKKLTQVIPAVLNRVTPGSTFMSIMGYTNNFDEVSNFGLVFHINYMNAVRKAMKFWDEYEPENRTEALARFDLLHSYQDTLNGFNPRARSAHAYDRSAHAYDPIVDGHNNPIKGVKWYRRGEEVHIWGFRVHKVIVRPGYYPDDDVSELAWARRRLIMMTPIGNYRQFKIIEGRYDHIGVAGLTLTHKHRLQELR
jgi:hypothetical protein